MLHYYSCLRFQPLRRGPAFMLHALTESPDALEPAILSRIESYFWRCGRDLSVALRGPLAAVTVVRCAASGRSELLLTVANAIADRPSVIMLLDDLLTAYARIEAYSGLPIRDAYGGLHPHECTLTFNDEVAGPVPATQALVLGRRLNIGSRQTISVLCSGNDSRWPAAAASRPSSRPMRHRRASMNLRPLPIGMGTYLAV